MMGSAQLRCIAALACAVGLAGCLPNPAFDDDEDGGTETATTSTSGGVESGPDPTTSGGTDSGSESPIALENLRVAWTTPNTIRWGWDPAGNPEQLAAYELVVATSEAAVVGRTSDARIWTDADNPELAYFNRPGTTEVDLVQNTVTDGHTPGVLYFAQLVAIDSAGERVLSNVAQGRTQGPHDDEIVVFSEAELPGWFEPGVPVEFSSANPFEGDNHYRAIIDCSESGTPTCWRLIKRDGLSIDLSAISAGDFASTAYLELAVSIQGSTPSWWSELWLAFEDTHIYAPFTLRSDGEYHVWQVPLRALSNPESSPPAYEDIAAGLRQFTVSAKLSDGAVVDVDEVRIRF